MTLWSLLKTYFQMKDVGSAWAWVSAWAVSAWAIRTSSPLGCGIAGSYSAVASLSFCSSSPAGTTVTTPRMR